MRLEQFNYHLPVGLIAQAPVRPRDHSRLLVLDRQSGKIAHDHFYNLNRYLRPDDVLVFNDTKVFPARLIGHKETGGRIEVFLLKPVAGLTWEVLIGGKIRRIGMRVTFPRGLSCVAVKQRGGGIWQVLFNRSAGQVMAIANTIGTTPTPPYIKKASRLVDYQTVYAKKVGSVAAPTAGFHFTKQLLTGLKKIGLRFEYVTLHVGFGTFQPVKAQDIRQHKIHAEYATVDAATLKRLITYKQEGRRIIAVGTTTVRVLETVFKSPRSRDRGYPRGGYNGWINTFIYPGYRFTCIDGMITNFHLPKSSLLMLVSAFAGRREILRVYRMGVRKKYRFYSFGDGMLIV